MKKCINTNLLILSMIVGSLLFPIAGNAGQWRENYFPNISLTAHDGSTYQFYDDLIKDKVVAINFIYTTCQYSCPLETARMRQVHSLLGDRVGKDVFFYSISIDPGVDSVETLAEYAERFQIGPGWLFLTGNDDEIKLLQKKLGMYVAEFEKNGAIDHNINLVLGNEASGQWIKRSPNDDPRILADLIGYRLHNGKIRRKNKNDYKNVSSFPQLSTGESLYRTRCSTCHTIGGGDGLGPDLLDVTERRDRDWLIRWLKVPNEMLAEKDPIAMALFYKYNQVPMPNLRLTDKDAIDLLEFIKHKSSEHFRAN